MAHARILIVEDEILVAREIESHLHDMAHAVVGIAIDSGSALLQVAETVPDLVLMDIKLPGEQDGIAIAGEIRDLYQIPVIYITAYADRATVERAKVTHPFGYILKPFSEPELRVAVELALFRHQTDKEERSRFFSDTLKSEPPLGGLPLSKLRKVLSHIDANLNQDLSLETLGSSVGFTTYHFARLFKQSIGKSVHQYIIHRRIERAKQLLRETELEIAAIATECGFANSSHLALHFKRIVGISPKKFRHF
ncbi:response regulator transcription factor [Kovacikia minuta CCNUW1]|uniref:response regulator transcription factor n=1 Tax=Kovacikia minuta TaxID=2931930 RepID=UPI001CCD027A|nr:response regulator transcription factor [Kovacikia minuta]UBF28338.1 response regulator transcription factor [Kovacikia minuta CCNUW1]